jgi:type VI secretion system protein ImpG
VKEDLLPYYERELSFLRHLGKEFAERHPRAAGHLMLEGDVCEDPHVERLIDAFAFLTARIHRKLDDEFPEIAEAFLGILYPHLLRPIPSMSVVAFTVDPDDTNFTARYAIPRHTELLTRTVGGVACRFRTAYPVDLWPLRVAEARVEPVERSPFLKRAGDAVAVVRLRLECLRDLTFDAIGVDRLRFFLSGDGPTVNTLYELLCNNVQAIAVSGRPGADGGAALPADSLRPVGFAPEEALLDYDARSFRGYRLLFDYFALPEKFLFLDLVGLDRADVRRCGRSVELAFLLSPFERAERFDLLQRTVDADTFRLGCSPVVNLFKQRADPIRLEERAIEHRVVPDQRRERALEVYSVDAVRRVRTTAQREIISEIAPFFSIRHGTQPDERLFWYTTRRPAFRKDDDGTEVYIALAQPDLTPATPSDDTLTLELTCTNRDLPAKLPFGGPQAGLVSDDCLSVEGAPLVSAVRFLRKPTAPLRPPLGRGVMWRLISHLSLNHLSIVEAGREALLEILSLYNLSGASAIRKEIEGVSRVVSRPDIARLGWAGKTTFCRGIEVTLEFDEDKYSAGGVFLFASVLERFLPLYAAINSFTRLVLVTRQREKVVKRWQARAGEGPLL